MNRGTIERQPTVEQILSEEQKALHEIQFIRNQQEMEGLSDRVLRFEESGGIRIVPYNDYAKETVFRDPEGKEQVDVQDMTIDEKNELDSMFETISAYEEMEHDDIREVDEDKALDEGLFRDDVDNNERDDMEYDE